MSPTCIRRRTTRVRHQWSVAERKRRAQVSWRRCTELLNRLEVQPLDTLTVWAGGAMSLSDVARIAG